MIITHGRGVLLFDWRSNLVARGDL